MQEKNLYIILEVKENATPEEIKNAYRLLAKKYHPDKNIGNKAAEEVFKEIQQAYAILSNPEKKRKYDQRFFRKSSPQYPNYNPHSSMPFTGNAYQYAQQQAQAKQRAAYTPKTEPVKSDRTESWQILVSVGIAMVLLYFIISYSNDTPAETEGNVSSVAAEVKSTTPEEAPAPISEFESPYSAHFGEEVSDMESKNSVSIFNSDYSEAVVCLVETKEPFRIIRNQYIPLGRLFKMNAVPDGEYSLRIYYGSDWDASKTFVNNSVKGGFKKELGFAQLNTGKDALKMKREKMGNSDSYSSYEVIISPKDAEKNGIPAAEFFRK